jgi:hypothetical protein
MLFLSRGLRLEEAWRRSAASYGVYCSAGRSSAVLVFSLKILIDAGNKQVKPAHLQEQERVWIERTKSTAKRTEKMRSRIACTFARKRGCICSRMMTTTTRNDRRGCQHSWRPRLTGVFVGAARRTTCRRKAERDCGHTTYLPVAAIQ